VQQFLQWKSKEYYIDCVCICSLKYAACNANVPLYHLWPYLSLQDFPIISHKRHDFRKMSLNIVCCRFIYNIFLKQFHSKKNLARCGRKLILFFTYSTLYYCPILKKLEYFRKVFEKYWNIEFHENPSSVTRVVLYRLKDGRS